MRTSTGEAQHLACCFPTVWGEHEKSPEQRQPAKDRSARWSRRERRFQQCNGTTPAMSPLRSLLGSHQLFPYAQLLLTSSAAPAVPLLVAGPWILSSLVPGGATKFQHSCCSPHNSHLLLLTCQQHVGTGTIPLPQMWLQLNAENSPAPCSSPRNLLAPSPAAPLLGHGGARGLTWCCPSPAPFPSLGDAVKPCCSRCCGYARCCCLVPAGGAGPHGKSS